MSTDDTTGDEVDGGRRMRGWLKRGLALAARHGPASGATMLIYHRIGGGSRDELDVPTQAFTRHLELLEGHDVLALDAALDRLDAGDTRPGVVITFDDGFDDVHANAWPLLSERRIPFTVYLASSFMGEPMVWEGSTAKGSVGRGMTWAQLGEMVESGLCTLGNHTHRHVPPGLLSAGELDECTAAIRKHLGVTPMHFTYPWGISVPEMEDELRDRFRSASTGLLGRNVADTDRMRLLRVPVRQSDPDAFFAAKLNGGLGPERVYDRVVRTAKSVGVRG